MYEVRRYLTGPLPTNTYTIKKKGESNVILIDPGSGSDGLFDVLSERGEEIEAILITHGHADHVDGVSPLKNVIFEKTGKKIKCYAPKADERTFKEPDYNSSLMIAGKKKSYDKCVDVWLSDNEELEIAGLSFRILITPGHTEGGACFYFPSAMTLFSGDTLFYCSVGRTDFPGGSMSELVRSVQDRLFTLPSETKVYPGHNEETTIETEKRSNPFFSAW